MNPEVAIKSNGNKHIKGHGSDLSAADSDDEYEIQVQKGNFTTHKDYEIKYADEDKRIMLYIDLCPTDLQNLMKDQNNIKNKYNDERRHIKNCIFFKKIETPNSGLKGNFHITYLPYKGLNFNIYFNRQKCQNNPEASNPLLSSEKLDARMKIIYDSGTQLMGKKFVNKWIKSEQQNNTFSFNIPASDIQNILNNHLLLQVYFDRYGPSTATQIGLINQGNICYLNSFLQVLYHFIPLRHIILQLPKSKIKKNQFLKDLQQIFVDMHQSRYAPSAVQLLQHFPRFNSYPRQQQDIHEFMISLFDQIEKECPQTNQLWCGKDIQIIRSFDNQYQSKQEQDFNQLQLHMADTKGNSFHTIKQAMKEILAEQKMDEQLNTDEMGKITVFKSRNIQFLPPLLFLNVKRYQYNTKRKQLRKINLDQTYQYEFDASFLLKTPGSELNYILYAVVIHKGKSPVSGHYFTFVNLAKNPNMPQFYQFNDSFVSQTNIKKVLNDYTGKKKSDIYLNEQYGKWGERQTDSEQTAYMLVYIRKDKFEQFQTTKYTLPTWHRQRLQKKLTEQEARTKISCKTLLFRDDQDFDLFDMKKYEGYQDLQGIQQFKLKKQQEIQEAMLVLQPFLGQKFTFGTIWKVNTKSHTIKYTGKSYGEKCKVTLSRLCEYKRGFRQPDYFLLVDKSKTQQLNFKEPIGIIHIEEITQNSVKNQFYFINKSSVNEMIIKMKQSGDNLTIKQDELQHFQYDWNDYLFIRKE